MVTLRERISDGYLKMVGSNKSFSEALEKAEKDIYIRAYKYHGENQTLAAKSLGVSRGTFITKMKKWGELK